MSWIDSLSKSARMAFPAIRAGVRQGLSIEAIGKAVRGSGLRISNEALWQGISLERKVVRYGQSLKFLRPESKPNYARLPQALTRIARQFSFQVEVRGTDLKTGELRVQQVTVSTSSELTRGEIERKAGQAVIGAEGRYGIAVDSAVITFGMQAGSEGSL